MKSDIYYLLVSLLLLFCCGKATAKESIGNPVSENFYQNETNNPIIESYDTIINGVQYAYAIVLSDKHIMAFEKHSEEYKMWQYVKIITDGIPFGLYNEVDFEDDLYYDDITPSSNKEYVYFCAYYTTLDINDDESVILKFSSGNILEIATGEIVRSLSAMEVGGEWTFQNQYIVNEEILFDPTKQNEFSINEDDISIAWNDYQDSLRNEILKRKENKILKESFLQEMYIRNVISISNDSLFVVIPFDVHSNDCGARDCFSTDVYFSFKLGNKLVFPQKMQFVEHERGCIEEEYKLFGNFILIEETSDYVIYHSTEHKRTLTLFRTREKCGSFAFYFAGVEKDRINGENVSKIREEYNEEEEYGIYPFTSWNLDTFEYENFLHKDEKQ